jgi:hypothetical protein
LSYVDVGLAVLLVFIGATLSEIVEIGVGISLLLIVGVMSVSIAASLFRQPQHA